MSNKNNYTFCDQLDFIFGDSTSPDIGDSVCIAEGIPLAVRGTYSEAQLVGIPQGCEGHVAIFGGTGSGKSTGPIMAAMRAWKGAMVVTDPKGELYSNYKELYDKGLVERQPILFDPTDEKSVRYDPYWLLNQNEYDRMSNITALSHAIAPMPSDCREPYWYEASRTIIEAGILYYWGIGLNFSKTMSILMGCPLSETIKKISPDSETIKKISPDSETIKNISSDSETIKNISPDSETIEEISSGENGFAKTLVSPMKDLKLTEFASHEVGIHNLLKTFAFDQRINNAFNCNCEKDNNSFCWDKLQNCNVFLRIPEERIEQWAAPVRLMLTQLFTYLMRRPDKSDSIPVLLLLDEVARFGKIEGFTDALCTLRSKNVNVVLALQSLAQLDKHYGVEERRIICDNCRYKLVLQAGDPETQKFLSDLIGVHRKMLHGKGVTTDVSGEDTGYSRHKSETYLPRVFPHELATLEGAILLSPYGYERFEKIRVYAHGFEELLNYQLLTAESEQWT